MNSDQYITYLHNQSDNKQRCINDFNKLITSQQEDIDMWINKYHNLRNIVQELLNATEDCLGVPQPWHKLYKDLEKYLKDN